MRLKTSSTYQLTRLAAILTLGATLLAAFGIAAKESTGSTWSQWRGPSRDGKVGGPVWPETINDQSLTAGWRVPVGPSYSGPIVSADHVFVTETSDKTTEIVRALDRRTGREVWSQSWPGAISVPFYAKSRGDWIRSTPAFDGKFLYVAGMRDVLVALDAKTGKERWRVDFASKFSTNAPDFGLICSPLIDGEFIYIQASNSTIKLRKATGEIVWRAFEGRYGVMSEGAFSSPVMATIQGRRQLVVQSREVLAGLDLESGAQLWSTPVASFRGMNILTPIVFGDGIFTSTYQNKSWLYKTSLDGDAFTVAEAWTNPVQCYMSTPVVIDGRAYAHLQNRRFACIDLTTGERLWTSQPQSEYCSLVAQGDRILALGSDGRLFLLRANPAEFEVLGEVQVSEAETWAHLAVSGDELVVRELEAISLWRWKP